MHPLSVRALHWLATLLAFSAGVGIGRFQRREDAIPGDGENAHFDQLRILDRSFAFRLAHPRGIAMTP